MSFTESEIGISVKVLASFEYQATFYKHSDSRKINEQVFLYDYDKRNIYYHL